MNAMNAVDVRSAADELIAVTLREGKTIRFNISTQSMLPTLMPGDHVTGRGMRVGEPRVGDIALMLVGANWLAHRVVARRAVEGKIFWQTQGDNCPDPDDLWSAEQICAIIGVVERNGRAANLELGRAHALGAFVAALARVRYSARQHRAIRLIVGKLIYASALIGQLQTFRRILK